MLDPTWHLLRSVFQEQVDRQPTRLYAKFLHPTDVRRLRLADKYHPREPTRDGFDVDVDV